jgi:hypothetical protein
MSDELSLLRKVSLAHNRHTWSSFIAGATQTTRLTVPNSVQMPRVRVFIDWLTGSSPGARSLSRWQRVCSLRQC